MSPRAVGRPRSGLIVAAAADQDVPTRPSVDWTFRGRPRLGSTFRIDGLELGGRGDRFLPDGEDPHARAEAGLEGRAAGDDLIDLQGRGIRPARRGGAGRGSRATASTSGAGGSSSIVTGSDCRSPSR